MWLRDFIPDDMPTARVLTYGNTSRLIGPHLSVSTLRDLAGDLLTSLLGVHRKVRFFKTRHIIVAFADRIAGR
jgi:hypothetical protein